MRQDFPWRQNRRKSRTSLAHCGEDAPLKARPLDEVLMPKQMERSTSSTAVRGIRNSISDDEVPSFPDFVRSVLSLFTLRPLGSAARWISREGPHYRHRGLALQAHVVLSGNWVDPTKARLTVANYSYIPRQNL